MTRYFSPYFFRYQLKPNCLLTRFALVFIESRPGFFSSSYWAYIPRYLKDHGYEVKTLRFSDKNSSKNKKRKELQHWLTLNPGPHHFFLAPECDDQILNLLDEQPQVLQSCHWVKNTTQVQVQHKNRVDLLDLMGATPSFVAQYYLSLAINLAERDH